MQSEKKFRFLRPLALQGKRSGKQQGEKKEKKKKKKGKKGKNPEALASLATAYCILAIIRYLLILTGCFCLRVVLLCHTHQQFSMPILVSHSTCRVFWLRSGRVLSTPRNIWCATSPDSDVHKSGWSPWVSTHFSPSFLLTPHLLKHLVFSKKRKI